MATQEANNKKKRPENDQNHSPFSLTELILRHYFYIPNNSNKFCNLPTKKSLLKWKEKEVKPETINKFTKKGEKKRREEAQGCNYGGLDPIVSVHHHLFMMPYAHACLKLTF